MPPAFVLSQNQTLKLMYDLARWNNRMRPASLGAVPAQIYKLVCLRIRTFARSASASRSRSHIKERHKFDRSILSPEALGDRAAAHMSLHLNRQCQRADASLPPVRLVPGIGCTDQEEARNGGRPKKDRTAAAGVPYMGRSPVRQPALLQFLCSWSLARLGMPSPTPLAQT